MTKVSFVRHWGQGENAWWELKEARSEYKFLELPPDEYTEGQNEHVFQDAITRLGLEEAELTYEDGAMQLKPPEGHMFRLTGSFIMWPDGSHFDWAYGAPCYSFEAWQSERQREYDEYIRMGKSHEDAETLLAFDHWDEDHMPSREFFHGDSINLTYEKQTWGRLQKVKNSNDTKTSDEPRSVQVRLNGFRKIWKEQAMRNIRLPGAGGDRLTRLHEYGMPGIVPCWEGGYSEGSIDDIKVEIVPIEEGVGHEYLPVLERLWVPENVRWTLAEEYPDLIDQNGDYGSRTGLGGVMSMLGSFASAIAGREGNVLHELAAKSDLMVIKDSMIAHMDTTKLVVTLEELIDKLNASQPGDVEKFEQELEIEKDSWHYSKKLAVITELTQNIHQIARQYGEQNDWFDDYLTFKNRRYF